MTWKELKDRVEKEGIEDKIELTNVSINVIETRDSIVVSFSGFVSAIKLIGQPKAKENVD